jgi:Putative glycerate kinase
MLEARRRALTGSLTVLSIDTDGVDGGNDVAGGMLCMSECRSEAWAHQAASALESSDSGGFLDHLDAAIRTGPTGTNLNDLRILLWRP